MWMLRSASEQLCLRDGQGGTSARRRRGQGALSSVSNNVINFLLFSRKLEEPSHATNIFNKRALAVWGCNTLASRLYT